MSHFLESIRINPNYAEAHYNLGVELVNFRKWDEASAQFAEAIRLDPNHASAHNNLANILLDQGRPAEAISALRAARLATCDGLCGRPAQSAQSFRTAPAPGGVDVLVGEPGRLRDAVAADATEDDPD